jgi:hypothetical protein
MNDTLQPQDSTTQATPGPWDLRYTETGMEIRMGPARHDLSRWEPQHVLNLDDWEGLDDWEAGYDQQAEAYANANLIVAAPDLLAALKTFVKHEGMHILECSSNKTGRCIPWCEQVMAAIAKAEGRES